MKQATRIFSSDNSLTQNTRYRFEEISNAQDQISEHRRAQVRNDTRVQLSHKK